MERMHRQQQLDVREIGNTAPKDKDLMSSIMASKEKLIVLRLQPTPKIQGPQDSVVWRSGPLRAPYPEHRAVQ